MSEQTAEWIDARERKPEGIVDVVAIIDWQDVVIRMHGEADKTGFREVLRDGTCGRSCAWSCIRYWLPIPPQPDPPDERKEALGDVFGGEWVKVSEYAYNQAHARVEFGLESPTATIYCGGRQATYGLADGLREALEDARKDCRWARDQLDDLLGPDECDPDTVAHPSEHLREWCEAQDGRWRDAVDVKHWKDVEFVLAGALLTTATWRMGLRKRPAPSCRSG